MPFEKNIASYTYNNNYLIIPKATKIIPQPNGKNTCYGVSTFKQGYIKQVNCNKKPSTPPHCQVPIVTQNKSDVTTKSGDKSLRNTRQKRGNITSLLKIMIVSDPHNLTTNQRVRVERQTSYCYLLGDGC